MSGCPEGREELASYALGLLDEPENLLFEMHLADCSGCARELEDILHTVEDLALVAQDEDAFSALGDLVEPRPRFVPRESVADFQPVAPRQRLVHPREKAPRSAPREGTPRPGSLPDSERRPRRRLRRAPWRDRRSRALVDSRRRRRLPAMLVAAAAVVLVSAGLAVLLIGPGSGSHNTARADESPIASVAPSAARFQNTDPRTGAHLDLVVTAGPFGTRLSGELSKVTGPHRCRLVAIGTTGATDDISSWLVPASGYGTPANPQPLKLQGTTSLTAQQIARVEVQQVDSLGRTTVLVAVQIH